MIPATSKTWGELIQQVLIRVANQAERFFRWVSCGYPYCKRHHSGLHCWHLIGQRVIHQETRDCRRQEEHYKEWECCFCIERKHTKKRRKRYNN